MKFWLILNNKLQYFLKKCKKIIKDFKNVKKLKNKKNKKKKKRKKNFKVLCHNIFSFFKNPLISKNHNDFSNFASRKKY